MLRYSYSIFTILMLALALGCTHVPTNTQQRLYVADSAISGLMKTAIDLRKQGLIPDEQWVDVRTSFKEASSTMDKSWELFKNGQSTEETIVSVENLITHIRMILEKY